MKTNPFVSLLRSRKFWLAVIDLVTAVLGIWLGRFFDAETARLIMLTWAATQPVWLALIGSIAWQNKTAIQGEANIKREIALAERWEAEEAREAAKTGCCGK